MNLHYYREKHQINRNDAIATGKGFTKFVFVVGIIAYLISLLGIELANKISTFIFYPLLFQIYGDRIPTLITTIIVTTIGISIVLLTKKLRLVGLTYFLKTYIVATIATNVILSLWQGNIPFLTNVIVLSIISLIIIGFVLNEFDDEWIPTSLSTAKSTLAHENMFKNLGSKIQGIEQEKISEYAYVSSFLGAEFKPKKSYDLGVSYTSDTTGLFSIFGLPHQGFISMINEKEVTSFVDICEYIMESKLEETVIFKIIIDPNIEGSVSTYEVVLYDFVKEQPKEIPSLLPDFQPNILDRFKYRENYLGAWFFQNTLAENALTFEISDSGLFYVNDFPKSGHLKSINGMEIHSSEELIAQMVSFNLNDTVTFTIEAQGSKNYSIELVDLRDFNSVTAMLGPILGKLYKKHENDKIIFGLDTNALIHYPTLPEVLAEYKPVVISKKVFEELDGKKSDEKIGHAARQAMKTIESLQERNAPFQIVGYEGKGLRFTSPDELIVKTYKKWNEENDSSIIFLSNDRGARVLARNEGLIASDIL
nr:PIN domain-containing protein [Lysinibacillus timonensis]